MNDETKAALILQLVADLTPYAIEIGIDIGHAFQKFQEGETVEDLIKELKEKRDDLPTLDFGEDGQ